MFHRNLAEAGEVGSAFVFTVNKISASLISPINNMVIIIYQGDQNIKLPNKDLISSTGTLRGGPGYRD